MIRTAEELKKLLEKNWIETWEKTYPDQEFRERTLQRVVQHYLKKNETVTSSDSWKRIIEYFLKNDWEKFQETKKHESLAKQINNQRNAELTSELEIKAKLREMERQRATCSHCFSTGLISAYEKNARTQYIMVFLCDCFAGELAAKLPENRRTRKWSQRSGEWVNDLAPKMQTTISLTHH